MSFGYLMTNLDIKVKEQTLENLMKGNKTYEPPRYMTINTAIKQLLELTNTDGISNYLYSLRR